MVRPSCMRWTLRVSLLVTVLILRRMLVWVLRIVQGEMTNFTTAETLVRGDGALVFIGVLLGAPCRGVC